MPEGTDLQKLIAAAWAAGYDAREAELICRRRSSPAHREAEIAKLTQKIMRSLQDQGRPTSKAEPVVAH